MADAGDGGEGPVVVASEPAPEEDVELVRYAREQLFFKSTGALDDMAKSLIALVSTITALFVSAMTFVKTGYPLTPASGLLVLLALLCWLASIYRNVTAYAPREYSYEENNPSSIRRAILEINRYKYRRLREGMLFFIAGLLLLAMAVLATLIV